MAAFKGGPVTVGVTASNLTTLLGLDTKLHFSGASIRANKSNTQIIWVGQDGVTVGSGEMGFIDAGEAIIISEEYLNTDQLYFVASSPQTAYVLLVVR